MNENDIKYCYIKSTNGISSENIYKLKNIFNCKRDKKMIKEFAEWWMTMKERSRNN